MWTKRPLIKKSSSPHAREPAKTNCLPPPDKMSGSVDCRELRQAPKPVMLVLCCLGPGFQSKCWMWQMSQGSWVWFAVLSHKFYFQTWSSTIKTYSSQQGNKTELPADSSGMGISEEAVRECQRERVNGQMMTILRENTLCNDERKNWTYELYNREREKRRNALLDIRQVQQRQPLRDGLKPDANLNTLLCMKTAGSPQQIVQGLSVIHLLKAPPGTGNVNLVGTYKWQQYLLWIIQSDMLISSTNMNKRYFVQ